MANKANLRDRVVDMRRIASAELLAHPSNPRQHPTDQKAAMRGILDEVGIADALVVYRSPRAGNGYVIIDGHMRAEEFQADWPCVVVDLTDDEADLLIQAHDAVGALAVTDAGRLRRLRDRAEFEDASVRHMLDALEPPEAPAEEKDQVRDGSELVPDMELRPYEHYDYLLVLCRTTYDWYQLLDRLEVRKVKGTNDPRYKAKVGLGRAIAADRLLAYLIRLDEAEARNRTLEAQLRQAGLTPAAAAVVTAAGVPASAPGPAGDDELRRLKRGIV